MTSLEAISPELVLVDPELGRVERARLIERAELRAIIEAESLRREERRPATLHVAELTAAGVPSARFVWWARRLLREALVLGLLVAGGVGLAIVVSSTERHPTSRAAPPSFDSRHVANIPEPSAGASLVRKPGALRAEIERRLLGLMLASPRTRLPRDWIDTNTGLAKNNLQVSCRRAGRPGSFRCTARLASQRRNVLVVGYRQARTGRGSFIWPRTLRGRTGQ
jgi:hypothetical protein